MNQVFSYITWSPSACVRVAFLGTRRYRDALWEEGEPAEAV